MMLFTLIGGIEAVPGNLPREYRQILEHFLELVRAFHWLLITPAVLKFTEKIAGNGTRLREQYRSRWNIEPRHSKNIPTKLSIEHLFLAFAKLCVETFPKCETKSLIDSLVRVNGVGSN